MDRQVRPPIPGRERRPPVGGAPVACAVRRLCSRAPRPDNCPMASRRACFPDIPVADQPDAQGADHEMGRPARKRQRRGPARPGRRRGRVGFRRLRHPPHRHRHDRDRADRRLDLRHQPAHDPEPAERRLAGDPAQRPRAYATCPARPARRARPGGPDEALRLHGAGRHRGRVDAGVQGTRWHLPRSEAGAVPRRHVHRLRPGRFGHRAVLLPGGREGLHRPELLRPAAHQARCAGRLRAGLRDRARGRPPRAEAAGHLRQGGRRAPRRRQGALQRTVGAPRAAGRLLRRHLGQQGAGHQADHRGGGRRRGPERRHADRRRHAATQGQRHVQPETFTHGTSAQRVRWFKQGFTTGQIEQCDTFKAGSL